MAITTLSSQEVNQDLGWAERAVRNGPVFITDRGRTTLVLLSAEEYGLLANKRMSIGELLSCPEAAEIDFDPPKMDLVLRPAEFD
jgi:prevent-host-death family protein